MTLLYILDDVVQTDSDDDVCHFTCCIDENLALCGENVSDLPLVEGVEVNCAWCVRAAEDAEQPCPRFRMCLEAEVFNEAY